MHACDTHHQNLAVKNNLSLPLHIQPSLSLKTVVAPVEVSMRKYGYTIPNMAELFCCGGLFFSRIPDTCFQKEGSKYPM